MPVTVLTCLLALVAVAGYLRPAPSQELPVRVLFDNKGGNVIFHHLAHHRDYEIGCAECHHKSGEIRSQPLPCGSCHPVSFNQNYVNQHIQSFPDNDACVQCHHAEFSGLAFDHQAHEDYYASGCQDCHHGPEISPQPQNCKNCHHLTQGGDLLNLRDASHERCSQCHAELMEKGLGGCAPCHKTLNMENYDGPYTSCSQCHDRPEKDLVRTRTAAFHDQCMDCHQERQKGPYKDEDCNKCHIMQ